ncbi:hypothetical protein HHI36_020208 [Cryptolaemus montrouzieri]|uniref:Uncharacterized protein n=1 Tax=Cryptolaemus montrouzieri TaxID=559131 RepID=A0ABD2N9T1_9CUCU
MNHCCGRASGSSINSGNLVPLEESLPMNPSLKEQPHAHCHGDTLLRTSSMIVNVESSDSFLNLSLQNSNNSINFVNISGGLSNLSNDPARKTSATRK